MNREKGVRGRPGGIIRAAASMAAVLAITVGCGGITGISGGTPSGPGPEQTEARLRQIASTTSTPIYYLGARFREWPLDDAIISTGGTEAKVLYGADCIGGDCFWHVEVGAEDIPLDGTVAGCSRLEPLHGVPTVSLAGDSVILFTGQLAIRVGTTPGDVELARQAAAALRRFGESAAVGTLPPPPASKLPLIDAACGRRPGEHGPELPLGPEPGATELPDFTVPRLGGGQLRWADYVGRPVVVVAGDVIHVAPAVRRLAGLASGGESPAVIGLIWDPFGDKEHPAPATEIERQAGLLPAPVGYPATFPAVWLSDNTGIDPGQLGVIGFFKNKGTPLTVLLTDASDGEIRAAIQQLR